MAKMIRQEGRYYDITVKSFPSPIEVNEKIKSNSLTEFLTYFIRDTNLIEPKNLINTITEIRVYSISHVSGRTRYSFKLEHRYHGNALERYLLAFKRSNDFKKAIYNLK